MLDSVFVCSPVSDQLHHAWCGDVAQVDCLLCNNSVTKAEWTSVRNLFGWSLRILTFFGLSPRGIRIADFKGCVLLLLSFCCLKSHQLFAAACSQWPWSSIANSFTSQSPLKNLKCTKRRLFKLAIQVPSLRKLERWGQCQAISDEESQASESESAPIPVTVYNLPWLEHSESTWSFLPVSLSLTGPPLPPSPSPTAAACRDRDRVAGAITCWAKCLCWNLGPQGRKQMMHRAVMVDLFLVPRYSHQTSNRYNVHYGRGISNLIPFIYWGNLAICWQDFQPWVPHMWTYIYLSSVLGCCFLIEFPFLGYFYQFIYPSAIAICSIKWSRILVNPIPSTTHREL